MYIEIFNDGDKCYYKLKIKKSYVLHNPYGCSYRMLDNYKSYRIDNKLHNELGPAVIYSDGNVDYFLNNRYCSYKEWLKRINKKDK